MIEVENNNYKKCTLNNFYEFEEYVKHMLLPIFDAKVNNMHLEFNDGTCVQLKIESKDK